MQIIYEDDQLIVINKESGVVTNRADTVSSVTLQDMVEDKLGIIGDEDSEYVRRSGMVHRLDKETSGVIVFAKDEESMYELMRQFKEREVQKSYIAITHGRWKIDRGIINIPIGRQRKDRKKFGAREDGKSAVTRYEVIGYKENYDFPRDLRVDSRGYSGMSLVEFRPKTGRTHQIRVHAKMKGHPVVGDYLYAGKKRFREDRKWSGRIMLHAQKLRLLHPKTKETLEFEAKDSEVIKVWNTYLR